MMKTIRIVAALWLLASPAAAQGVSQIASGAVWGNSTAVRALAAPAPLSAMLDRALAGGNVQGAVATRNATLWIGLAPGTAGLPLLSGGAAANLAYGVLGLSGGGTAAGLTASNGGLVYSTGSAMAILAGTVTAGQIPRSGSSAAPSWSAATYPATAVAGSMLNASSLNVIGATLTPVLGASGTLGTLGFGNATTGTVTLQPVAGALGSAVLTMPAATDTIAVLATAQALTNKTYNGNTWTAGTGTLTIAAAKTLTANNSLTLAGTDTTTMTFPSVSATITRTVASGAKALATGAIGSAACTAAQTDTATGTLTTDAIAASFNADPTAVTGYVPLVTGMLTIIAYPTADTANFKVCNNTAASITPGAITINWRVLR